FGMVMGNLGCASHGATMVIPADAFDATHVLETIQDERCTAVYGVPTMFIAELGHPEFDRFHRARLPRAEVTLCYCMTETSPVSTQALPDDSLHHRTATVGRAHPHVEIRIAEPDSPLLTLERGQTGEFCTRGYSVMHSYWDDIPRTAMAIDRYGWMHTGDLAVM